MSGDVALVTGASSGIGRAIATRLAGSGYRVFGTSRSPATAAPIPGVTFLPLDVTDEASAMACVAAVIEEAGRLDVLVNNAGIAVVGALEEVSMAEARRQMETNFFGVLRMIQAALPGMRRQRAGLILNIGSVVGHVPIPFAGLYDASKFALAGATEALRHEVAHIGIRVALIEPGFFKSDLVGQAGLPTREIDDYRDVKTRVLNRLRTLEAAANPPGAVADLALALVRSATPALHNLVGKEKLFAYLKRFMPEAIWEPQAKAFWKVTA